MPPPLDIIPHLLEGLAITVLIAVAGCALAIVCAVLAGLGRRSRDIIVRGMATTYVAVFRGTSAVVRL